MPELSRKLTSLIGIRLLVVMSVGLAYALTHLDGGDDQTGRVVVWMVALVSIQTLLYLLLLKVLASRPKAHAYVQFCGDLLLITFLIAALGEGAENFSILYLVVIGVAAALLRRSAALIVAGLAFVFYSGYLALGNYPALFGGIQRWVGLDLSGPSGLDAQLAYKLAIHLIGFYLVAILTSQLAHGVARAEAELEEKSHVLARFKVLHEDVIQSVSSGLVTTDLAGVITSLNRAGEEILGLTEAELEGRHVSTSGLFAYDDWEDYVRVAEDEEDTMANKRPEVTFERFGEEIYVGFSISPLRASADGEQRGYILNFQDLTAWRELQERARRNDRMAAVGEIAAGIAHELGNPLAAISGAVQMLSHSPRADEEEQKLLGITLKESKRLAGTIRGFLEFAKPRGRVPSWFDVSQLLAESVQLLRTSEEVSSGHEIVAEIDPPSFEIFADPDHLRQVFWNLASNALRAMPEGGRLEISGRVEAERYQMSFHDTGRGMTEDERAKLFQPFSSFFDKGVGLGLSIVYSIVEEHGGEIAVESTVGKGSKITVELPIAPADAVHREEARAS